jgi:hypothetical protein
LGYDKIVKKNLVGKRGRKRTLGRSRERRDDNVEIYNREIGFRGGDWIHLARDCHPWQALVNMIRTFGFHERADFLTS